jgi:hypothetical protein
MAGQPQAAPPRRYWHRRPAATLDQVADGRVVSYSALASLPMWEGYFGHDHDKWHRGFYQTLERPDTKSPCCNLTIVAHLRETGR